MFTSPSKKKASAAKDKAKASGLTAYGTLMKQVSSSTSTTGDKDRESEPMLPTAEQAGDLVKTAMDAANNLAAMGFVKENLDKLKGMTHKGPMTFRVAAFLGGVAMIAQCFMGSFSKLLSFSPLQALIEAYCLVFGVVTVILEGQDYKFLKGFKKR